MSNQHANWNAVGTGGARPGAGKPLDPIVDRWRKWMRQKLWRDRVKHYRMAEKLALAGEPAFIHQLYNKALPNPIEPTPAQAPSPPLLLVIGQNGSQLALGYAPQGIVPGMEALMPPEVVAALPPHENGGQNGKTRKPRNR